MNKLIKISFLAVSSFLLLSCFSLALAQETATAAEATTSIEAAVSAKQLGISEPTILPNNPFYFLKNWQRTIKELLTFDPIKKAELKMKNASERLLEARKLAEKTNNQTVLEKATENYNKAVDKIKEATDKIKDKAENNPKVQKFLDKFTQQQNLHERILNKLQEKVPAKVMEKIKDARENHLQKFNQVMQKLENKEAIKEEVKQDIKNIKEKIASSTPMKLIEAIKIAKDSECGKKGSLTLRAFFNENSQTWWIDLNVKEKNNCHPACVVNVATKTAEINWRCTGLIMPDSTSTSNTAQ